MATSIYCASCGAPNKTESKFCAICGKKLNKAQAPESLNAGAEFSNRSEGHGVQKEMPDSSSVATALIPANADTSLKPASPPQKPVQTAEPVSPNVINLTSKKQKVDSEPAQLDEIGSFDAPVKQDLSDGRRKLYFKFAAGGAALIALLVALGFAELMSSDDEPSRFVNEHPSGAEPIEPATTSEVNQEQEALLEQAAKARAELDRLRLENKLIQAEKADLERERERLEAQRRADEARLVSKIPEPKTASTPPQSGVNSPAFKAILEKAKKCYRTQDYDCAINSAEVGLDLVPGNKELKIIIAESQKRQAEALNNIVIQ